MARSLTQLLERLDLGRWPVLVRRPLVQLLVKRKSLDSFSFRCKLHGFDYIGDAANLIDYHILSRGTFEPGLTHLLRYWGSRHPGGLLLDVGANVGVHSLGACRAYARVVAVEPYPPLVGRLGKTIHENTISNITLVPGALGRATGKAVFAPPGRGNLGTGRVVSTTERSEDQELEVSIRIGDDVLAEYAEAVKAIKIDVEGFEDDVLHGLADSLAEYRPLVVCELLSGTPADAARFRSNLPEGYTYFSLERIKRYRFELHPWQHGTADVVAAPEEKADLLAPFIR